MSYERIEDDIVKLRNKSADNISAEEVLLMIENLSADIKRESKKNLAELPCDDALSLASRMIWLGNLYQRIADRHAEELSGTARYNDVQKRISAVQAKTEELGDVKALLEAEEQNAEKVQSEYEKCKRDHERLHTLLSKRSELEALKAELDKLDLNAIADRNASIEADLSRRQAEANAIRAKTEELEERVNLLERQKNEFNTKYVALEGSEQSLKEDIERYTKLVSTGRAIYPQLQNQLEQLNREKEILDSRNDELAAKIKYTEDECARLQEEELPLIEEKVRKEEENEAHLRSQIYEFNEHLKSLKIQIDKKDRELADLSVELDEQENKKTQIIEQLKLKKTALEHIRAKIKELNSSFINGSEIEAEAALNAELENLRIKHKKKEEYEKEIEEIGVRQAACETEMNDLRIKAKAEKEKEQQLEAEIANYKNQLNTISRKMPEIENKKAELSSLRKTYQELVEDASVLTRLMGNNPIQAADAISYQLIEMDKQISSIWNSVRNVVNAIQSGLSQSR